jgi:hypothetical protein
MWKEVIVTSFETLCQNLPVGGEKKHGLSLKTAGLRAEIGTLDFLIRNRNITH